MYMLLGDIWLTSLVISHVPSGPLKVALLVLVELLICPHAISLVPFHQTVLEAIVSQLPLLAVPEPFLQGVPSQL
jgi:hypothetical protein